MLDESFAAADEGAVVTWYYWLDAAEPEADAPDSFMRVQSSRLRTQIPGKAIIVAILRLGGIDLEP